MIGEHNALLKNNTWTLTFLPPNRHVLGKLDLLLRIFISNMILTSHNILSCGQTCHVLCGPYLSYIYKMIYPSIES